ncbi:MAG: cytochrome b5-like heme/steroid binding domain-containing protein [Microgenomates group bacterium]
MRLSIRNEFIVGIISVIIVFVLIAISTIRYQQKALLKPQITNGTIYSPDTVLNIDEIAKHSQATDCWIIIESKVYVVNDYLTHHPGGAGRIIPYCGADATQAFITKGGKGTHSAEAFRQLGIVYIGDVNGKIIQQPDKNSINALPVGGEDDDD